MNRISFAGEAFLLSYLCIVGLPIAAAQPVGTPTLVPLEQPAASAFLSLLPDGEDKRRFILDCTGCHQFDARMIGAGDRLKGLDEWTQSTELMLSFAGGHTGFPIIAPSRDAEVTAVWLVRHLGGERTPIPEPVVTHEAAEHVSLSVVEYVLPSTQDLPHDLVLDRAGRVVITGQLSGNMYILDPEFGLFTTVPIPVPNANPRALFVDEGGVWWVLLGGPERLARYDPAGDAWDSWPIGMHAHSLAPGPDGRIWFNGHFTRNPEQIGYFDTATEMIQTFEVPSPPMPDGGSTIPYGLRMDGDGILWGTQLLGGRLIRFDPETEAFALFPLPTPYSGPRRLDVSDDGTVWIPEYAAGRLARFDPAGEHFTEFALPIPDALPYIVRVDDRRGWVWIATAAADVVLRFHVEDERFDVFTLPTPHVIVRHMELNEESGTLWLSYGNFPPTAPKIVRIDP